MTGSTASTNFPTKNPFQPINEGRYTAFVAELNPAGSALVYSTYLGGSGMDTGRGIALDSSGNAYVTGDTGSANFPVTPGAFQTNWTYAWDAFVTKFDTVTLFPSNLGFGGQRLGVPSSRGLQR